MHNLCSCQPFLLFNLTLAWLLNIHSETSCQLPVASERIKTMDDDEENEIEEEVEKEQNAEYIQTIKMKRMSITSILSLYFFFIHSFHFIYLTNTELKPESEPKSKRWEYYYYICAMHFALVPIVGNNSTTNRYVKMKWKKINMRKM